MATSSLASAASSFVFTSNITNNCTPRTSSIIFANKHGSNLRRLVVRAEEASAVTETKEAPKPPPIGPKRGAEVLVFGLKYF